MNIMKVCDLKTNMVIKVDKNPWKVDKNVIKKDCRIFQKIDTKFVKN